jgi:hypothetical protein
MVTFDSLMNAGENVEANFFLLIIIFVVGLLFAFYGANIMKALAGLVGAILGATFAVQLAMFFREELPNDIICIILAAIIGAIIGAYLAISLMKMLIIMFFGMIGFLIGLTFSNSFIIAIIVGIILAIIISLVIEQFLAVITALLGGLMIGYLTLVLFPEPLNIITFLALTVIIGAMGAKYQLSQREK